MNEQDRLQLGMKVSRIAIAVTLTLTIVKLLAGLLASSTAMVADAVHSCTDVLTTIFVIIGLRMGSKPADREHPYGHARMESVAAKLVATLLVLTALGLIYSSGRILLLGEAKAPGILAIYAAIASIVAQEALYRYSIWAGKVMNSTAVIADAWHHRSDALSSVGTLVGVAGARLAYPWLDPVAGLVVALIVLKIGIEIYLKAVEELVDASPSREVVQAMHDASLDYPGVINVNQLKARKQGPRIRVDLEICVDASASLQEGHDIAHGVEERLQDENSDIEAVMVHVNPCQRQGIHCKTCAAGQPQNSRPAVS